MADGLHLSAALRADALLGGHVVGHEDALEMRRQRSAPSALASVLLRELRAAPVALRLRLTREHCGHGSIHQRQRELALEPRERLRGGSLPLEVRQLGEQLGVGVTHPSDQRQDRDDDQARTAR